MPLCNINTTLSSKYQLSGKFGNKSNRHEEFVGKMQKEDLALKKLILKSYFQISLEKVQSKSTYIIYKSLCTYLSRNCIPSSDIQKQKNDASAD